MGVYIKGMEMPKSCERCIITAKGQYAKYCVITGLSCINNERQKDCPLVEVPSADVAPVRRWISVSERLPMPQTKVLLAYKQGVTIGYLGGYPKEGGKPIFHGVHGYKHILSSVTHWQYPPETPKDGE